MDDDVATLDARAQEEMEAAERLKAANKAAHVAARHNGPFMPTGTYLDQVGIEREREAVSVRQTGFLPGNNMAAGARPKNVMHFTEVVKMMLGWPEQMVIDLLTDTTQSVLARGAAAQVLLYLKGDDQAVDRVLDRTDGPVSRVTANVTQQFLSVNDGRTQVSADLVKAAFDAVSTRKKEMPNEKQSAL
jgi:hypothetical protein